MKIRQRNEMPISKQNTTTFYYFVVVARRIMVNTRSQNLQNYWLLADKRKLGNE